MKAVVLAVMALSLVTLVLFALATVVDGPPPVAPTLTLPPGCVYVPTRTPRPDGGFYEFEKVMCARGAGR